MYCKATINIPGWKGKSHFLDIHSLGYDALGEEYKVYNGRGGYFIINKHDVVIEKTYSGDYDEAYSEYVKDTPLEPQEPCARLGFISPDGKFYPCGYCCHEGLARRIFDEMYPDYDGWDRSQIALQKKGWVAIMDGMVITRDAEGAFTRDRIMNPAQKATVLDVLWKFEEAPGTNWFRVLQENPEGYDQQAWMTMPPGEDEAMSRLKEERERLSKEQ